MNIKQTEIRLDSLYSLEDDQLEKCGFLDEWGRPYRYKAHLKKEIITKLYAKQN